MAEHDKAPKSQLRVGRLTKAHGLKGAIKIELFTDDPDRRFIPGATFTLQVPTSSPWHGKTLELNELKFYNGHPVAFFKDVPDRTVAESLVKAILWVDHDMAEQSQEEDAWFDHQLVGLRVMRDGVEVGEVTQIDHFPAQDLLTVRTDAGDVLVPFVKAIVPAVDVTAGTLTVTPPAGLFEELPEEPPEAPEPEAPAAEASEAEAPAAEAPAAEAPEPEAPAAEAPAKGDTEAPEPEASQSSKADALPEQPGDEPSASAAPSA